MICIFIWLYIIALSFLRRCWQEIKQKLIFSSGDRQSSKDSPDREARTKKGKTSYNLLLLSQLSRWAHFYIWGGPISIFEVSPFLYLWWALFTFQLSRWAQAAGSSATAMWTMWRMDTSAVNRFKTPGNGAWWERCCEQRCLTHSQIDWESDAPAIIY